MTIYIYIQARSEDYRHDVKIYILIVIALLELVSLLEAYRYLKLIVFRYFKYVGVT